MDAVWEPILDEEKFHRVQDLLKKNNLSKHNGMKRTRHTYVLNAGLLWCGACRGRMEGRSGTGSKGVKYYYYLCTNKDCRFKVPAGEMEGVVIERIRQLATEPQMIERIIAETNQKLQTDLPKVAEQQGVLEKELAGVKKTADGLMEQWETLATDDGAVFLKERLDELGKRRGQIEAGLDEVLLATEDIEKEAVDQSLVTEALANFSEVFQHIPP